MINFKILPFSLPLGEMHSIYVKTCCWTFERGQDQHAVRALLKRTSKRGSNHGEVSAVPVWLAPL